jgi:FKBP-type peptidyl-prolyl cis-trans isomerase
MKTLKSLLFISALVILTAESCAQKSVDGISASLIDSTSYAMGVNIGSSLKNAQLQVLNTDMLMKELTSVLKGHEAQFEEALSQSIIQNHFVQVQGLGQNEEAIAAFFGNMSAGQKDSLALAIGGTFGDNMRREQFDILDMAVMNKALKEALEGKEPRYDMQQMQTAIRNFAIQRMENQARKNQEAGEQYMQNNAKRAEVVTLPSGLQYEVLAEGNGVKPTAESVVKVHYSGTLIDGREFDSSYKRGEPAEFPLNGVIKGWSEGLQYMSEGASYKFYIPAELAYGNRPMPGTIIEPGSTLVFEVELLEIIK